MANRTKTTVEYRIVVTYGATNRPAKAYPKSNLGQARKDAARYNDGYDRDTQQRSAVVQERTVVTETHPWVAVQ